MHEIIEEWQEDGIRWRFVATDDGFAIKWYNHHVEIWKTMREWEADQ